MNYTLADWQAGKGTHVIAAGGELDMGAAPALRETIERLFEEGIETLVVDTSEATFIDSTTIGVLMGAKRRLRLAGGSLQIVCTEPNLLRIFEIVGLSQQLSIRA
jgi:anti-sigma B factor antagonist